MKTSRSRSYEKDKSRTSLTTQHCREFITNPYKHPITGKELQLGTAEHKRVMTECANVLISKNIAHEIAIAFMSDERNFIDARQMCLDAVNKATSVHDVYDPITKQNMPITTAYSKDLLDLCQRKYLVWFLHLELDDDGKRIFIPVILNQVFGTYYEMANHDAVKAILNNVIEDWTIEAPHTRIKKLAMMHVLLTWMNKLINHQTVLGLHPGAPLNEMMISIREKLIALINSVEIGQYDSARLGNKHQSLLKKYANAAKTKLFVKSLYDANCNSPLRKMEKTYTTISMHNYVHAFSADNSTLDMSPSEYRVKWGTIWHDIAFHDVKMYQYIFLDQKHAKNTVDDEWLQKQHEYIMSLDTEQIFNMYGYTHNGDVFVNNHLRGTFSKEKFEAYLMGLNSQSPPTYFPLFFPCLRFFSSSMFDIHHIDKYFDDHSPHFVATLRSIRDANVKNKEKYKKLIRIVKYLKMECWSYILQIYCESLDSIIKNAPTTTRQMYVYRGVQSDFYLKDYKQTSERQFTTQGFVSTSSSINIAYNFTTLNNYVTVDPIYDKPRVNDHCCFMRILVPARTRLVLISGVSQYRHEAEFLMGSNTLFYITKSSTEKWCTNDNTYIKMRVTDMVDITYPSNKKKTIQKSIASQ